VKRRKFGKAITVLTGMLLLQCVGTGSAAELSLDQAVKLALEQNIELRITEKGIDTAKADLKSARGANSFNVNANAGINTNKTQDSARTDSASEKISVTLPIYNGGKTRANIRSGKIGVDAAELQTARKREDVRLSVIKKYYDVLEAKKKVSINRESVDKYRAHLTNVQNLYRAGSKAKLDVLRSSVELADAKQNLIKSENNYEVELLNLRKLLRLDAKEPLVLTDDFNYTPFFPRMENCVEYALNNRKDLLIDEYTVQQKELAVKSAKAGFLPSLNLSASGGLSQDLYPNNKDSRSVGAGLSASWNIFDSGVTRAAVDKAKTALEVAKLNMENDQESVNISVRQAYYNMREAEKRLISTQTAVGEAKEDYFIANEKYRAGQGILLDVIDAQVALSTAELNNNSAQYDYARYKATVENEMGLDLGLNADIADPEAATMGEKQFQEFLQKEGDSIAPPVARSYEESADIVNSVLSGNTVVPDVAVNMSGEVDSNG